MNAGSQPRTIAKTLQPFEAVQVVRDALAVASRDPSLIEDGHVTAAGLCRVVLELAIDEFRAEAEKTLRGWNVRSSEDVGQIVARLIEIGALEDSEVDDVRKFQGHDVKEVWGAGQQQVRNVWSNIGCWHLNRWLYTFVELCCWDLDQSELTDRRARPWDNPERRPSHADRRRWISREMLEKQFLAVLPRTPNSHEFRTLFEALVALAI
jgi:uncharacterized repeat protein (TIGR04138 family)